MNEKDARNEAIRGALQSFAMMIAEGASKEVFMQIRTLIDAFIWSEESSEIVREAAIKVWRSMHLDTRPIWKP